MSNLPLNKKIIAFDIDSTLTESKQKLRYDIAELLLRLMEKAKVAIISGGSFHQFEKQIISSLNEVSAILKTSEIEHAPPSSLVAPNALPVFTNLLLLPTNGSKRYDYDMTKAEWKLTHLVHFPADLKEKVFQAFEQLIQSNEFNLPTETFGPALEDRVTEITFSALGQEAPVDQKQVWDPDQAKRQKIKAYLEAAVPEVNISIGGMTSIDIMPKGSNKATGLESLLEVLGMTKGDMLYVGDALFPGGNDYSVLEDGIETVKVANPLETAKLIKGWLS
jgi:phosphomannomutase